MKVVNQIAHNVMALTSGHKTLGVKWLIEGSASHQGSVSGDTFAATKTPTAHTADRWLQGNKRITMKIRGRNSPN
jgi:hypothetical protein